MKVVLSIVALIGLVSVAAAQEYDATDADPTFRVYIHPEDDNRVFAEVEGLLTKLTVREGSYVREGDVLATIDDRQAQAAYDVAKISHEAALERAEDDIEERYAKMAAAVAKKDYEMGLQANANSRVGAQAISEIEMEKKRLDWQRAVLQTERAQKDQRLARRDADVKEAELHAAKVALERRTVVAPFDGEVVELLLNESEWANPGDPVLRLVRFDVMRVECYVDAGDYDPAELFGRPITLRIRLARNREATIAGRVVYVNQLGVDTTRERYGTFLVRAEVQNQREGDFWLVRPGLPAEMTIHVNEPAVEAALRDQ